MRLTEIGRELCSLFFLFPFGVFAFTISSKALWHPYFITHLQYTERAYKSIAGVDLSMKGAKLMIFQGNIHNTKWKSYTNCSSSVWIWVFKFECGSWYEGTNFLPSTTSSYCRDRKGIKVPFTSRPYFSYALAHCYTKPYYSVLYGIGLKRESQLFGILRRRPFTKETNYAFGTRTREHVSSEFASHSRHFHKF